MNKQILGSMKIAIVVCSAVAITGCSNISKSPANMTWQECNYAGLKALEKYDEEEAENLIKAGLKKAQAIGPNCPEVATSLSNLAHVYEKEGEFRKSKLDEAEALYEQALAINGGLNPYTSEGEQNLQNLADLYGEDDMHTECRLYELREKEEPIYKSSIDLYERSSKPDTIKLGGRLTSLGELYQKAGLYSKAEPLFKKSLAVLGDGCTARLYADLLEDTGREEAATKLRTRYGIKTR